MMLFLAIITFFYVFLLLFLLYGSHQVPVFCGNNTAPKTTFSIVIPFRNEAENLPQLFDSLKKIEYPRALFEVLLIDDASEDDSEEICSKFFQCNPGIQVKILASKRESGSPKKDAITTAVAAATKEFILTTDADCIIPENWLREFNAFIVQKDAEVIAGPVGIRSEENEGSLARFEQLDFFSLQTATLGGFGANLPFMCNGANFCYSKKAFSEVKGFDGNSEVGSGDDIFLLEKFRKAGFCPAFLRSRKAIVWTLPQKNFKSLVSQRIRWAAKTSSYHDVFAKLLGLVVLLINLSLVLGLLSLLTGSSAPEAFLLIFLIKFNVDFLLIYRAARFFERENLMKSYLWCSLIYPFFSSGVALASLFSGYDWKGRKFKK